MYGKYRASNGKKFFNPQDIQDGVWSSPASYYPLWAVYETVEDEDGKEVRYPSWAVDRRVALLDLPNHDVHAIRKFNKRTGETWTISYADFVKYGTEGRWGEGHGEQVACPQNHWTYTAGKQKTIKKSKPMKRMKREKTWLNLNLFGGLK